MAFQYGGNFSRKKDLLQAYQSLSYDTFTKKINRSMGRQNQRRMALLIRGIRSDDAQLQYQRAKSLQWLKSKSKYFSREEIASEG